MLSDEVSECIYCGDKAISIDLMKQNRDSQFEIIEEPVFRINISEKGNSIEKEFRIIKPIGRGGFGRVIEVENLENNRHYAMKVPFAFDILFPNHKDYDQDQLGKSEKYLLKEIETFANILGKHFDRSIRFIDKGQISGRLKTGNIQFPVFLMELADASVKDIIRLEAEGKIYISFAEKKKIIKSVINALNDLHHLGVVHRDLSPDNILIVNREGELQYVLGDFGGSKQVYKTGKSSSLSLVGKESYIDPERIINAKYGKDRRMDIYSLGIIITEILMGNFWGKLMEEEEVDLLSAVDFEIDFLKKKGAKYIKDFFEREKLPGMDEKIIDVLGKAVKRKPGERYDMIDSKDKEDGKGKKEKTKKFRPCLFEVLCEEREIELYFTVELPFTEKDETFLMKSITLDKKTTHVELENFQGTQFRFSGFTPGEVKLKNTSLLSLTPMRNSFILKFQRTAFDKLLKENIPEPSELSGKFKFKAVISVVEG